MILLVTREGGVDGVANKYIMCNSAFSMDWEGYVRYPTMVDGIHIDAKN